MEMSICPKLFYKLNKLQRKHKWDLFIIRRADPKVPIKKRKGQEESGGGGIWKRRRSGPIPIKQHNTLQSFSNEKRAHEYSNILDKQNRKPRNRSKYIGVWYMLKATF